ncbi:MAG: class 1 isoprenoid biosynthesis enzyme [Prolixibacteraceae bacterium]
MDYSVDFIRMWNESAGNFPVGLPRFNQHEKRTKEEQFELFQKKAFLELNTTDNNNDGPANYRMMQLLSSFFRDTVGYPEELTQIMFSEGMMDSTLSFIRTARQFDPAISPPDLFQAVRNVWIMNGLQFLMDRPVCLTPPIFAYSMLYPYTDNYLDNPTVTSAQKDEFCGRFGRRLNGEELVAFNKHERKIFKMVSLIEGFWNRDEYPRVYRSLLNIHEAQSRSVGLIKKDHNMSFDESFGICLHKGGASVIADGYLVFGDLTPREEEFFYHYGAYLQLLDDLQDTGADLADSLMTAYATLAERGKLDIWLNKTYSLGLKILDRADHLSSPRVPVFKALMKKSIDLFLTGAVLSNKNYFSESFVDAFESFSPVRFSFIGKKEQSLSPYSDQLVEQMMKKVMSEKNNETLKSKAMSF